MPLFTKLFERVGYLPRREEGWWGKEVLVVDLIKRIPKHYEAQEDYDAQHPWRYWHTSKDTRIPAKKTSIPSSQCDHHGPIIVDHVQGGHVSQCLMCEMWGPLSETPEKARQLLINLGMRSSAANESRECRTKEGVK